MSLNCELHEKRARYCIQINKRIPYGLPGSRSSCTPEVKTLFCLPSMTSISIHFIALNLNCSIGS